PTGSARRTSPTGASSTPSPAKSTATARAPAPGRSGPRTSTSYRCRPTPGGASKGRSMTGTGSALAARGNGITRQQNSAVAIRGDQDEFNDRQRAALVAMGVSDKVTRAELAVFFHQCRNLRLDPFSKQIYLIHRRVREGDAWVLKPTTQIGIDGFRVTR